MATHSHHPAGSDKGAAFVGLFSAMIFLLVVVFATVKWTNARFAGHAAGEAPAGAAATH